MLSRQNLYPSFDEIHRRPGRVTASNAPWSDASVMRARTELRTRSNVRDGFRESLNNDGTRLIGRAAQQTFLQAGALKPAIKPLYTAD